MHEEWQEEIHGELHHGERQEGRWTLKRFDLKAKARVHQDDDLDDFDDFDDFGDFDQ